ncbi:hypothetical protein GCM10009540_79420 [Streptomyces turgidiscabies]
MCRPSHLNTGGRWVASPARPRRAYAAKQAGERGPPIHSAPAHIYDTSGVHMFGMKSQESTTDLTSPEAVQIGQEVYDRITSGECTDAVAELNEAYGRNG